MVTAGEHSASLAEGRGAVVKRSEKDVWALATDFVGVIGRYHETNLDFPDLKVYFDTQRAFADVRIVRAGILF